MMGCIRQWFTERELKKDTVFTLIGTAGASVCMRCYTQGEMTSHTPVREPRCEQPHLEYVC